MWLWSYPSTPVANLTSVSLSLAVSWQVDSAMFVNKFIDVDHMFIYTTDGGLGKAP